MRKEATRAIIYARFSTDRQNEKSVDDQIALCAARCAREGWEVVDSFSDRAVSGSTPVAKRVGGAKMLAALMAREADVLVLSVGTETGVDDRPGGFFSHCSFAVLL